MEPEVIFFATPDEWRRWLAEHHAERREVWVGLYKKGAGRPTVSYQEAVDQALCFGWIDGLTKGIDADSYRIRFTPRKASSNWSNTNIRRVGELTELGLMHPAGLAAFEARKAAKSGVYAYEQRDEATLDPSYEAQLRGNEAAWEFFQAQPPGYRKTAVFWIVSAKQEATRLRRLATLIECSEQRRAIPPLTRPGR